MTPFTGNVNISLQWKGDYFINGMELSSLQISRRDTDQVFMASINKELPMSQTQQLSLKVSSRESNNASIQNCSKFSCTAESAKTMQVVATVLGQVASMDSRTASDLYIVVPIVAMPSFNESHDYCLTVSNENDLLATIEAVQKERASISEEPMPEDHEKGSIKAAVKKLCSYFC